MRMSPSKPPAPSVSAARRPPRQVARQNHTGMVRWLTGLSIGVAIGMLGLGALVMLDSRKDAWQEARQASANLAIALERDIGRNIAVYDLSLQGAVSAVRLAGLDQVSPDIRHSAMFAQAARAEYLGALLILDSEGRVVADSTSLVPHNLNLAAEDYFATHRERADAGLFISRPFRSPMMAGEPAVAISRRLSSEDGRFHGVVMGALRLAYFEHLFRDLNLGPDGSMTLFRTDGRVIANYPAQPDDLDRDLGASEQFRAFAAAPDGSIVADGPFDAVTRLHTFRRVADLPLILSVGISVEGVYGTWWRKAVVISFLLALLCGATVFLCALFRRELFRRIRAERALTEAAAELSVMASTDALTGLLNRRAFEVEMHREWRRVSRGSKQIALLMLDADWYKLFNDCYGHQAGDRALQTIAGCIRRSMWRPCDVGARYGGEEFIVLLPDTDLAGARAIAESIRAALAGEDVSHAESPLGRLTLSVGLAVANPVLTDPAFVIRAADDALYAAKRAGRDRVSVAAGSDPAFKPASSPGFGRRETACQAG